MSVLESKACFAGSRHSTRVRIARFEDAIYLDLADEEWHVVEITQRAWSVVTNSPVKFCRPRGLRALPAPIHGGDLLQLRRFVNCSSDDQFVMIVAWLLGTLMAAGPYPILEVSGEQGCAKSTTCRVLRQLIDPNKADLRSLPRNERHLAIAARNSHILGFDNLSRCDSDQSDALCRIATGSGFSSRELFTNFDECLFSGARPIVMNGIGGVASRPDLLDRTIRITLPAMDPARRIDERRLWASFYEARPSILGALLDAVSTGLCRLDETELDEAPRMADFARWVKACEPALPWNDGDFLRSYAGNRRQADIDAIDASVIGPAILTIIETSGSWKGTATELLRALAPQFENRPPARWPTDGTRMSKELRRIAPPLRACGYEVAFGNDSDRWIRLGRLPVRDDANQRG